MPAFRALRAVLPEADIALVGLPWAAELVDRFDRYLDRLIPFPGYPGLPERQPDLAAIPPFLERIQRERFDLALQMHGSGEVVNPLVALFGAGVTAGFCLPGAYCPDPERFIRYPEGEAEPRRHLRLLEHLGIPPCGEALEIPLRDADFQTLAADPLAARLGPGAYACVHPGAGADARRWPPERFAAVADALVERGLRVVLTGSAGEAGVVGEVERAMRAPAVNLVGRMGLGPLGALLSRSRLLVSNDTGVYHVSRGLGVPSVAISTEPDARRWGPSDAERARHRFLLGGPAVSVAAVVEQADELLATLGKCPTAEPARSGAVGQTPDARSGPRLGR